VRSTYELHLHQTRPNHTLIKNQDEKKLLSYDL
jgi:hypothetical protein